MSEKVKQINVELGNILKELEGFSSEDPGVQARLQALQGKLSDATELTDDAQRALNECETESNALRPFVSQGVPAKANKAEHAREKRSKSQSERKELDRGSLPQRLAKHIGIGKGNKRGSKTEDEGDAGEELGKIEKNPKHKIESNRATPYIADITDEEE